MTSTAAVIVATAIKGPMGIMDPMRNMGIMGTITVIATAVVVPPPGKSSPTRAARGRVA